MRVMTNLLNRVDGIPDDAEIQNCTLSFECPKHWGSLQPTSSPKIRHCTACDKNVHFCSTAEELMDSIILKNCVAFMAKSSNISVNRILLGVPR
jgi:hypothetical protein